jgi:2-phospho-L-lactate guanylyltransferase (CobY/MobA/RfbA family)
MVQPLTLSMPNQGIQSDVLSLQDPAISFLNTIAKLKEVVSDETLGTALLGLAEKLTPKEEVPKPLAIKDLPMAGATKLKRMLEETNDLIVCPGVYDGLSARVAMEVGFDCLYMVSFSQ